MKSSRETQYKRNAKGKPLSQPFPIVIENITGLRATHDVWPSYRGVFTGCSVLISHQEDAQALHTMGCFGQASTPQFLSPGPKILRRRQFKTRRDWSLLTAEQSENGASSSDQKSIEKQKKQDSDSDDDFHLAVSGSDDESQNPEDKAPHGSNSQSKTKNSEHSQDLFGSSDEESPQADSQDFKLQVSSDDSHPTLEDGSQDFHLRIGLKFHASSNLFYCMVKDEKVLLNPEIAWQLFSITQESFASRYVIYHYFRAHNFVVRSGLKFGGDFCKSEQPMFAFELLLMFHIIAVLYREGPSRTHASYVVLVVRQGSNSWQHVMTANRISETTRKVCIYLLQCTCILSWWRENTTNYFASWKANQTSCGLSCMKNSKTVK
ncbi:hypothetical protein B566_EDAN013097 [Ephemera danica]|nr:hypothetical protein B566_EDAN013097 [Ephemera danica]